MSDDPVEIASERTRQLVLARLLVKAKKPLSPNQIIKSVAAAIAPPLTSAAALSAAGSALEDCKQRGYLTYERQIRLTAEGEQTACGVFRMAAPPRFRTWAHAQQAVALASIGHNECVQQPLQVGALTALVLAKSYGLPDSVRDAKVAVDRLAWRALGLDTEAAFTIEAVQRHLLRQIVPSDVRVTAGTWRRMLAMRAIGANGHDAKSLVRALLAKPLSSSPTAPAAQASPHNHKTDAAPFQTPASLSEFASAVRAAAGSPLVAHFHDDRAFIASVWEHMRGRSPIGDMSLAEFKNKLITAHRQRLLRITRADLVAAMDPEEVRRSEARYQDATFHFVALDAPGER